MTTGACEVPHLAGEVGCCVRLALRRRIAFVRFDLFRGQGLAWPDFVEDVGFIETTGAGTCWVLDHYVYPPAPEAQFLESWTTLAGVAAVTERIRLGTAVTDA